MMQGATRSCVKLIRAAAVLGLLALGAVPSPAASRIVFPPDKSLVDKHSLEVLGFRPEGDAAAELVVTGNGVGFKAPVPAGVFRVPVSLAPGANVMVIGDTHVTVFLGDKTAAVPAAGFEVPDTHAVDSGCEDCHVIEKTGVTLTAEKGALCANCHDDVLKGKDGKPHAAAHPPADEGDCFACHKFHGAAIKRLSPAGKRGLCFECHDDFTAAQEGKSPLLHKPVAQGDCTGCHGPHGGAQAKLLHAAGTDLCRKCHKDPSLTPEGAAWKVPHPALDDGCQTCHLAHAAPAPRLLKEAQAPLCFECHEDFLQAPEGKEMALHPPAADGECSSCHRPHGSAEAKLLTASGKDLCLGCHDDPAKNAKGEEWAVAHPALDDGCLPCHRPHVSAVPRLLAQPTAELCAGCHENKNLDGSGEEWASPHQPVKAGMCTSCHGPHGGPEKALLLAPVVDTCRTCHKEVHAKHQRVKVDALGNIESTKATLPPGFPVRKKDGMMHCTGCHQPHGSAYQQLWTDDGMMFCSKCHINF